MADTSAPLKNVSLRQLRVFATVARRLNFTAAARELHLTQPAVSMQVRELETSCGLALFEKVGRRLHLTEAGEELSRCAANIDDQLRQTRESLDALAGLDRGLLQLGAVSTAKYFAPSLLAAFRERHPGVTIRFSVGNRDDVIRQLAGSETDLVIMGRPPRELATVAEKFARHPFGIIAAPGHPLAGRRRIPLKRLVAESFVIREPGSGTRATMEHAFRERGATWQASLEASSNETIKQAVMAGMGVSFISLHTVGLELAAGRLVCLDVVGLPVVRDWWVMHLASRRLAPMAAAFRQFLLQHGSGIITTAVDGADTPLVARGA